MKINWTTKLQYFLQTLAFCVLVAAIQYAFQSDRSFEIPLVYSLFIGGLTWALIDFGRHLFASSREDGWPLGLPGLILPLVGVLGAYVLGTLAGDGWFGWSSWSSRAPTHWRLTLLVSVLASSTGTFYFYTKNKRSYLENKMAEARQHAHEARLKLLESQLEPHMLFNTLANLQALIGTDPQHAQEMLNHLIAYLRATLNASRAPMHPLQNEFDRLRDYLEIMSIRMGPRLRYTMDLPSHLTQVQVPTLLLQPLVENAIKHGLEPKVQGGSITVLARQRGKHITLTVHDTGVGLQQHSAEVDGFGLAQVRERLSAIYGDQGAIELVADDADSTRASVTFPYKT